MQNINLLTGLEVKVRSGLTLKKLIAIEWLLVKCLLGITLISAAIGGGWYFWSRNVQRRAEQIGRLVQEYRNKFYIKEVVTKQRREISNKQLRNVCQRLIALAENKIEGSKLTKIVFHEQDFALEGLARSSALGWQTVRALTQNLNFYQPSLNVQVDGQGSLVRFIISADLAAKSKRK